MIIPVNFKLIRRILNLKFPSLRFQKRHLTFFRLHVAYFIIITIVGTLILRGIGSNNRSMPFKFIDCLYCITSALCVTGLSSFPIEYIPAGGQVVLMLMMILGGQIVTSMVPLLVKKRRYCKVARLAMKLISEGDESAVSGSSVTVARRTTRVGAGVFRRLSSKLNEDDDDVWMEEMAQREKAEHLKEVFQEYQATVLLIRIVMWYYIVIHLLGFSIAWISIACSPHAARILNEKNINKGFFALFMTISSFANAGFVLANENMLVFQESIVLMLDLIMLMLLGNTLYAPALRNVIWVLHRCTKIRRDAYEFLLTNPRKCYTHLFPQVITRWLCLAVMGINGFECAMFYLLDWDSRALQGMSTGSKLLNGLFQSVNTRSCGMNSVNLADLSGPMLFLYAGSMYVAAYPVYLSRQYSRDRPKDISEDQEKFKLMQEDRDMHDKTISTQSRRLLATDCTFLFLSMFFICVSENNNLKRDSVNYGVFNIIFEVISAYGNVGLTLGYTCALRTRPGACVDLPIAFSGKWGVVGKLFIIVVMFLGRHRGLPDKIDSAIILPEEKFSSFILKAPVGPECTDDGLLGQAQQRPEPSEFIGDGVLDLRRAPQRSESTDEGLQQ